MSCQKIERRLETNQFHLDTILPLLESYMKRSNVTLILIFSSVQKFAVILTVQYTILLLNTYLSKYAHTWHGRKEK